MYISQINNIINSNPTQNFKAKLKVNSNVYEAVNTNTAKLRNVIEGFRKKLAADPLNPGDIVELRKITGEAKEICKGGYIEQRGSWQGTGYGQVFVPERSPNYPFNPVTVQHGIYAKENLEIVINRSKTGFLYNDERSEEQIAEDMYNTYKHVRYLEHYKK